MRRVQKIVDGVATQDGAGVRLKRVIGSRGLSEVDPFLLLDEFRSDHPRDYIAGFPDHPHRGFQTVTYMLAGKMRHHDNKGHSGVIGPGGVQWMHAGKGIVHSEMPEQQDGLLWGFQLWVNLSAAEKMSKPTYQEFAAEAIPSKNLGDAVGTVKVVAGALPDGTAGPVRGVGVNPLYLDYSLLENAQVDIELSEDAAAFVYVYKGELSLPDADGEIQVNAGQLAVLSKDVGGLRVRTGAQEAKFLVVAAKPLGEPIARYGPFVMNSMAEIEQAISDYRAGLF